MAGSSCAWRLRQPFFQSSDLPAQRSESPVSANSNASAIDDLPEPLRPTTSVSPGPGRRPSLQVGPTPRNPVTATDSKYARTGAVSSLRDASGRSTTTPPITSTKRSSNAPSTRFSTVPVVRASASSRSSTSDISGSSTDVSPIAAGGQTMTLPGAVPGIAQSLPCVRHQRIDAIAGTEKSDLTAEATPVSLLNTFTATFTATPEWAGDRLGLCPIPTISDLPASLSPGLIQRPRRARSRRRALRPTAFPFWPSSTRSWTGAIPRVLSRPSPS